MGDLPRRAIIRWLVKYHQLLDRSYHFTFIKLVEAFDRYKKTHALVEKADDYQTWQREPEASLHIEFRVEYFRERNSFECIINMQKQRMFCLLEAHPSLMRRGGVRAPTAVYPPSRLLRPPEGIWQNTTKTSTVGLCWKLHKKLVPILGYLECTMKILGLWRKPHFYHIRVRGRFCRMSFALMMK